ncbi:MAG: hypothetical protein WCP29_17465 [Acidobacteriota bacterium]
MPNGTLFQIWRTSTWQDRILLAVAFVLGSGNAFRYWSERNSLWQDEISAITHALQPWPSFLVEIVRNEIHPPVYFALLKLWQQFLPSDDRSLLLSSVFLQLCALTVLGIVAAREFGPRASAYACLVYAAMPIFPAQAGNLRMYALASCLILLTWQANCRLLREPSGRTAAVTVFLQTMTGYTHLTAFMFVGLAALGAYGSVRAEGRIPGARRWRRTGVATAVLLAPLALLAFVRGGPKLSKEHGLAFISHIASMMLPWQVPSTLLAAYGLGLALLLALGLVDRRTRPTVLVIPIGACVLATLLAFVGRPLFRNYVFAAYLLPIVGLCAARGLTTLARWPVAGMAIAACLCSSLYTWAAIPGRTPDENYAPATSFLKGSLRPGDTVYVAHYDVYWGILRYCVGPRWGEPLDVMPLHSNDKWQAVQRRLGTGWADRLRLVPQTDRLVDKGVAYVFESQVAVSRGRIWFVSWAGDTEPFALPPGAALRIVRRFGRELTIGVVD